MSGNKVVDFPSEFKEKKPWKSNLCRLLGLVILIVAVFAYFLFGDGLQLDELRRSIASWNVQEEDNFGAHTFSTQSNNRYALYDGGLAIASVSGLELYGESSSQMEKHGSTMSNPGLSTTASGVLAFDIGGDSLVVADKNMELLLEVDADGQLLDADIASDNALCYAQYDDGNKTLITVCNSNQQEIYKWYSATRFMPLCTVTSSGKLLAAVSLGQEDGVFYSTISFFDTTVEGERNAVSAGEQLLYDLEFLTDKALVAVGENQSIFYDEMGNVVGTYDYEGNTLEQFTYWDSGNVTLALTDYSGTNQNWIVTLDKTGKVVSSGQSEGILVSLSTEGKYLAVLTTTALDIYTSDFQLYSETLDVMGATTALMNSNGSCYIISGGKATLYTP